jgi:hypothetical protein
MACDQNEKISLLIDGELQQNEARALELHLSVCRQCSQVRGDFLVLRSQIGSYAASMEESTLRPALATLLSKSHSTPNQTGWRGRFFGFGDLRGFNAQLAAVAALVLIAVAIATIAFLRYRPQHEQARNPPRPDVSRSPDPPVAPDLVARESGRKPSRGQPRETSPRRRKSYSPIKPRPERSAPKPLPQLQITAPPNYALAPATNGRSIPASTGAVDTEALTVRHFEQSELLLRAFRNLRPPRASGRAEIAYERRRARQLLYQNILLRREADSEGDVQVAALLGSLEPILLDIANLRDHPRNSEVQTIKERVERTSLVPLLQINSMAVARAND